ncbi:type II toxin-antitoxin system Phd/YefM family antitoxin [Streptomyces aureoverticillatus]|uniref:type II toxin-antitoxin system Phd/YefM family antitoxin n=1 Tax=Streptomyces aureoverticillatus TaxID=66871 RepID=UPI0013DB63D5|nr:type II toxin-antitoxin system Phd/YefM family antitoxin [Streptomyces aureoverticillatus]QIB47157.1 type II toxin-antitoxin system Phd/YefM family antitoxin [Streptomyces aureoverticillatus]
MAYEIPVTQARAELADLINRVVYGNERVVVTRHGKPLVALVSADDLRLLEEAEGIEAVDGIAEAPAPADEPVISSVSRIGSTPSGAGERQRFGIAAEHRGPHMT